MISNKNEKFQIHKHYQEEDTKWYEHKNLVTKWYFYRLSFWNVYYEVHRPNGIKHRNSSDSLKHIKVASLWLYVLFTSDVKRMKRIKKKETKDRGMEPFINCIEGKKLCWRGSWMWSMKATKQLIHRLGIFRFNESQ